MAMVVAFVDDIAFFQGRLYALCGYQNQSYGQRLIAFELNNGRLDKPTPSGDKPECIPGMTVVEALNNKGNHIYDLEQYLVESSGKLLLVMLGVEQMYSGDGEMDGTSFSCDVWEADMSDRRWKKVDGGLDGQALMVSSPCSKSVLAAADGLDGARGDSIYFLHRLNGGWELGSGAYNMRTKTLSPLPQVLTLLLQELMPPVEIEHDGSSCYRLRPKMKTVRFPAWFYPNINARLTGCGSSGKATPKGGEGQPVGAKPWRTCATFFSFHPVNLFCMANWIRNKWNSVE
jgi:hypothetical protein